MVLIETSFPRGGTIQKRKESDNIDFGARQVKKKKQKTNHEKENESEQETKVEAISAELLTYKTIQEGMLLYGKIKHVDAVCLKVSLPGRIVAKVFASMISESYNNVLKSFIASKEEVEDFRSLEQMYSVGQSVYGKVTKIEQNELKSRVDVIMSFKPSDVHSNFYHENISKGMILSAAIEEIQDHGYVIESGIKNLRCFLPKENIETENENFSVGELIFVKIMKLTSDKNGSIAICKLVNEEKKRKVKDITDPRLECLMPSSIVNFTITKIMKYGIQGTIMNSNFTAYVNEHQLKDLFDKPDQYKVNSTMPAKILYIMPFSKLVYLSLKVNSESLSIDDILKRGTILEANVHHHGTGGIIFKIDEMKKGVMSFNSIKSNITGNFDQDSVMSKYYANSSHKIRIIDYDYVDNFYICSDNSKILNEKYFTLDDCKAGEFVTAAVTEKHKNSETIFFKIGNCNAQMEKMFQSPQTALTATEGSKHKCRILGVNYERNIVSLTNKQEYMKQDAKILNNIKKAVVGHSFLGTVVKCTEKFLIVKFFDGIKGILYKTGITGFMSSEMDTFSNGQTMFFRILKREGDKLLLTLGDEMFKVGDICNGTVENYLESGLEISIKSQDERNVKGLVPVKYLTEFSDINGFKLKTFIPGQPIEVACIFKNLFSQRDVEYFKKNVAKKFSELEPGDILRGSIKNIDGEIVEVLLPILNYNKLLRIHLKMILPNLSKNPNILVEPDQLIYVKILSKEKKTKALTVSAKLTDVWNADFKFTSDLFVNYLDEVRLMKKSLKSQDQPLGKLKIGQIVEGTVAVEIKETLDLYIDLENGIQGIIKNHLLYKNNKNYEFKTGENIKVIILWIDYVTQFVYCSNQISTMKKISDKTKLPENLINQTGISAKVLLNFESFVICSLKQDVSPLVYIPKRLHYNDFESSVTTDVIEGDFCRLCFIHPEYPIAVFEDTMKMWSDYKLLKKKFVQKEEQTKKMRKLIYDATVEVNENYKENDKKLASKKVDKNLKVVETQTNQEEELCQLEADSDGDIEVLNFEKDLTDNEKYKSNSIVTINDEKSIMDNRRKKLISATEPILPGANDFWTTNLEDLLNKNDQSSSEEDEDDDEKIPKKKKRLRASERFKLEKLEEERIRKIENRNADETIEPDSFDQFEKLILSDPNNSKNWIKYMAYFLQTTDLDKARAVAKRAVKSISYREQQDIINVWIAYLNLESNYGTKESFNDILKEALLCNDPMKIYIKVIEILTEPKKIQELTDVISIVTKKFKENSDIWKSAASAYFQLNMMEKGQQLLHRCLTNIPEREHVNTIVAFANLNHRYGDKETAHTLIEQILTSYPKRVDVWSQYVDMLLKDSMVEATRRTLERAVSQKIPLKKMRTLFKKYLEFEEKYGDETSVLKVKELAQNYVKQ